MRPTAGRPRSAASIATWWPASTEADSVVCDAHKMMFVPALCAMVFYRDRDAPLRRVPPGRAVPVRPDRADAGRVRQRHGDDLECTKRAAAFGLWGIWSLFGPQLFADMVDVTFDLAQQFHAMLAAADDFEPLHEPECNIVAFRYLPPRAARRTDRAESTSSNCGCAAR